MIIIQKSIFIISYIDMECSRKIDNNRLLYKTSCSHISCTSLSVRNANPIINKNIILLIRVLWKNLKFVLKKLRATYRCKFFLKSVCCYFTENIFLKLFLKPMYLVRNTEYDGKVRTCRSGLVSKL